ncbi:MAG: hypothetical protein H7A35_05440 [Planctomycetales bacterium]|nr:hypothetical protein [bacterium]UNM09501.1 MAG: hypothetical protein H7A35_05440 [Planctomycetales bacterium]
MGFTSAATTELKRPGRLLGWKLEARTDLTDDMAWVELPLSDFRLLHDSSGAARLRAEVPDAAMDWADPDDAGNPLRLLSELKLTATIGAESEVLFRGRVTELDPSEGLIRLRALDWSCLLAETECDIAMSPDETAEVAVRQLSLVNGGAFGSIYGFTYSGGSDPAFNQDANPGTRRRSFVPGEIRLWYDSAMTLEVSPSHYQVNLTGGTLSILEDTAGNSYWLSGVRCYIEGTLDLAEVYRTALRYPASEGGPGRTDPELDIPDLGLSPAGAISWQGSVSALFRRLRDANQANLRLWYDPQAAKFVLRLVEQQQTADTLLLSASERGRPRDISALYSRVVVSGKSERPVNVLADTAVASDISTQGDWFSWDGLNVGADSSFAAVSPLLCDGDTSRGASLHHLAASENGGTGFYDSWYGFMQFDLGEVRRVQRLRAVMPGSRNLNSAAGHQGLFWPGIRVLASIDGLDWRLLSPLAQGRFEPHSLLEIGPDEITMPRLRYLRVQLGAYKHGFDNQSDPSIGLAELELYCEETYRVVREIDPLAMPPTEYTYSSDHDGDGFTDRLIRNHPLLWARLGGRHRTLFTDFDGNEFLAQDRATDLLAESLRQLSGIEWRSLPDPRIRLWQTVEGTDRAGNTVSALVERVEHTPRATVIGGTDYLAEETQ